MKTLGFITSHLGKHFPSIGACLITGLLIIFAYNKSLPTSNPPVAALPQVYSQQQADNGLDTIKPKSVQNIEPTSQRVEPITEKPPVAAINPRALISFRTAHPNFSNQDMIRIINELISMNPTGTDAQRLEAARLSLAAKGLLLITIETESIAKGAIQCTAGTILCNGKCWSQCTTSQTFSCPAIGDAICVRHEQQQNVQTIITQSQDSAPEPAISNFVTALPGAMTPEQTAANAQINLTLQKLKELPEAIRLSNPDMTDAQLNRLVLRDSTPLLNELNALVAGAYGGSYTNSSTGGTNIVTGNSGTANTIGGTTYYTFDNGVSGTSNTIGGTTYYNFSDGTSGTANTMGGTTYYDSAAGIGTATTIGGTTYYTLPGGSTGLATTMGGTTYYDIGGNSGTSNTIGGTTYYDFDY